MMMARFVQSRDRKIFDELFRRYRRRIVAYVGRYVRIPALAEELAQEVFVRVYTTKRYEPQATFKTWLYRVATNVCLNELRKSEHRQSIQPMEEEGARTQAAPPGASPEVQLQGREVSSRLEVVLRGLPENQRVAFTMARMEGLSHAEISQAMALSIPAIKSAIHRALEALRTEVRDPGCKPAVGRGVLVA